jgi:ATP phosphoribosyltransferase regulatory subunit
VVALVLEGLTRAGLGRHRVGLGDASLYGTLLSDAEVPEADREPLLEALARRDLVELEALAEGLPVSETTRRTLIELPQLRGGPEVLDRVAGPAVEGLRAVYELVAERGLADRVIFDLGLVRELGYYTGMVFEVYDPAVGFTIGGGGRYDDLLARFGRSRPACGAGLDIDRVHVAQLAEERLA